MIKKTNSRNTSAFQQTQKLPLRPFWDPERIHEKGKEMASNIPPPPRRRDYQTPPTGTTPSRPKHSDGNQMKERQLYNVAIILNWITLVLVVAFTYGAGIIAAAWIAPITILMHKKAKEPYKNTALAVVCLLLCNPISGALMLIDDGNRPEAT